MIKKLILFIVALIIGAVLLPAFTVYTVYRNRYNESVQASIFLTLATMIDIAGNVVGLPIYELVAITQDGNTLFGRPKITISQSIGHLMYTNNLNERGYKLARVLNKVFHQENHCLESFYELNIN